MLFIKVHPCYTVVMAQMTGFLSLLDTTAAERRPMTAKETGEMMEAVLAELASPETNLDPEQLRGSIAYPTLALRVAAAGVTLTPSSALVMMSWSGMRPGSLVMWAYTAVCIARKTGRSRVTIDDLTLEFPFGIPTDEGSRRIWEAQKVGAGNGLDSDEVWSL